MKRNINCNGFATGQNDFIVDNDVNNLYSANAFAAFMR